MEIIQVPASLPGCCFFCLSTNRESYVDTKVSNEVDGPAYPGPLGAVYICNRCVGEFAGMYGFISEEGHKNLRVANEELQRLNYAYTKRVDALEESLRALANAGYKLNDDGAVIVSGGYLPKDVEPATTEPPRREESVGAGAGEITESSDDEGVGILSSDESDSEFELEF